jgi:hypothetical protein
MVFFFGLLLIGLAIRPALSRENDKRATNSYLEMVARWFDFQRFI